MKRRLSDYLGQEDSESKLLDRTTRDKKLEKMIADLTNEIKELKKQIEYLQKEMQKIIDYCRTGGTKITSSTIRGTRDESLKIKLRMILSQKPFEFASSLSKKFKTNIKNIISISERENYIVLNLNYDYVIIDPEAFKEFISLLSEITTPDPSEARERLGKYSLLFDSLRRASLIYYDVGEKRWRIIN